MLLYSVGTIVSFTWLASSPKTHFSRASAVTLESHFWLEIWLLVKNVKENQKIGKKKKDFLSIQKFPVNFHLWKSLEAAH